MKNNKGPVFPMQKCSNIENMYSYSTISIKITAGSKLITARK